MTPAAISYAQKLDSILIEITTWVRAKKAPTAKFVKIHPILKKIAEIFQLSELKMISSTDPNYTNCYEILVYNEPREDETHIVDYFNLGESTTSKIVFYF